MDINNQHLDIFNVVSDFVLKSHLFLPILLTSSDVRFWHTTDVQMKPFQLRQ